MLSERQEGSARIVSRSEMYVSRWVRLVTKEVEFFAGQKPETYHALSQADYITVFAITRSGLIPIVKQYRPAVEAYTWELPAGLAEPGEAAEETGRRELKRKPDSMRNPSSVWVRILSIPGDLKTGYMPSIFVRPIRIRHSFPKEGCPSSLSLPRNCASRCAAESLRTNPIWVSWRQRRLPVTGLFEGVTALFQSSSAASLFMGLPQGRDADFRKNELAGIAELSLFGDRGLNVEL